MDPLLVISLVALVVAVVALLVAAATARKAQRVEEAVCQQAAAVSWEADVNRYEDRLRAMPPPKLSAAKEWRHPLAWRWLDSKLGLAPGWGVTVLIVVAGVLLQLALVLLRLFCMPCIQTMCEALSL